MARTPWSRLDAALNSLGMDERRSSVVARAAPLLLVYAGAVLLLTLGPASGGHPRVVAALYQALQYFTLSAPWLPDAATPDGWAFYGWSIAFLAPAITASALVDGALALRRSLSGPEVRARSLRDHVIVAGYGDHGRALARIALAKGVDVVLVDRTGGDTARLEGHVLPRILGELTDPEVLAMAGLERAQAVYFCSGDPLVNLNGALVAREKMGGGAAGPRLVALVDDVEAEGGLFQMLTAEGPHRIELIDQFSAAAAQLMAELSEVLRACVATPAPRVAILGFGRFGSALARELFKQIPCEAEARPTLIVVDLKASYRVVDLQIPSCWNLEVVPLDVEAWVAAQRQDPPDFVFLSTSDDATNLRCAARLRRHGRAVPVVLRMLNPPRPLQKSQDGVVARNIVGLFQERMARISGLK